MQAQRTAILARMFSLLLDQARSVKRLEVVALVACSITSWMDSSLFHYIMDVELYIKLWKPGSTPVCDSSMNHLFRSRETGQVLVAWQNTFSSFW